MFNSVGDIFNPKPKSVAKETKKELDLIKLEVRTLLEAEGFDYGSSSKGRFSISKRTNWAYSQKVTDKVTNDKTSTDELKSEEQKNGTASKWFSESLLFHIVK